MATYTIKLSRMSWWARPLAIATLTPVIALALLVSLVVIACLIPCLLIVVLDGGKGLVKE